MNCRTMVVATGGIGWIARHVEDDTLDGDAGGIGRIGAFRSMVSERHGFGTLDVVPYVGTIGNRDEKRIRLEEPSVPSDLANSWTEMGSSFGGARSVASLDMTPPFSFPMVQVKRFQKSCG